MDIIPSVALYACGRQADVIFHGVFMAGAANEPLVRTIQGIVGLGAVVELPKGPTVRVMAEAAIRTETALMNIVGAMATGACRLGILVGRRQVAFLARRRRVQADKGKTRNIVIEKDPFAPTAFVMAVFAPRALLPFMNVVLFVTVVAPRTQVFRLRVGALMAGLTGELRVPFA